MCYFFVEPSVLQKDESNEQTSKLDSDSRTVMHVLSLFLKCNCCYVIPGQASALPLNQVHFLSYYISLWLPVTGLSKRFHGWAPVDFKVFPGLVG